MKFSLFISKFNKLSVSWIYLNLLRATKDRNELSVCKSINLGEQVKLSIDPDLTQASIDGRSINCKTDFAIG